MKKNIFFFLLLFFGLVVAQAQNHNFYDAYVSNRMDLWKYQMDRMEKDYATDQSYDVLFDLTVAHYGYIAYCMSMEQKKRAKKYVLKAEVNAKKMLKHDPKWARVHALLGAIYGFKAGQAPYKAPILGIRAMKELNKAFDLDPTDPHIWMEKGNVDLYKPAIFGGNKRDAILYYLKAIELFEEDSVNIGNNWLYLNTLSGLATAYVRTEQINKADLTYQKIIDREPDFKWISEDVYPSFRAKYF
jgi:tetratricopeptide (TPR) repeat protein